MTIIFLYSGSAKFSGGGAFDWASPAIGDSHKIILFLAQTGDMADGKLAQTELERYGFSEIVLGGGRPIVAESLNSPSMAAFQKHYEGAFAEGSSLAWYP